MTIKEQYSTALKLSKNLQGKTQLWKTLIVSIYPKSLMALYTLGILQNDLRRNWAKTYHQQHDLNGSCSSP